METKMKSFLILALEREYDVIKNHSDSNKIKNKKEMIEKKRIIIEK